MIRTRNPSFFKCFISVSARLLLGYFEYKRNLSPLILIVFDLGMNFMVSLLKFHFPKIIINLVQITFRFLVTIFKFWI